MRTAGAVRPACQCRGNLPLLSVHPAIRHAGYCVGRHCIRRFQYVAETSSRRQPGRSDLDPAAHRAATDPRPRCRSRQRSSPCVVTVSWLFVGAVGSRADRRPAGCLPTDSPRPASRMADRWRGTIPSTPRPRCQSYRRLMLVHPPASMRGGWLRFPRGVRKPLAFRLSGHAVQVPCMNHYAQSSAIALMAVNIHASGRTHEYGAGRPPFVTAMARARRRLHRTARGISSGWHSSAAGERDGRRHHVQISGRAPGAGCTA